MKLARRHIIALAGGVAVLLIVLGSSLFQSGPEQAGAERFPLPEVLQKLKDRGLLAPQGFSSWEAWFADSVARPMAEDRLPDLVAEGKLPAQPPPESGFSSWGELVAAALENQPPGGYPASGEFTVGVDED